MRAAVIVYGVSIAAHLGVAGAVLSLKQAPRKERVAVTIREIKKAAPKPPEPEAPPPPKPKRSPPKLATAQPRSTAPKPAPLRAATAPAAAAPVADFGLTLASGDGPAIARAPAVDRPGAKQEAEPRRAPRPKVLAAPEEEESCPEAPIKPKPLNVVQPAYTDEARAEQIEGKVRIEITVGADGAVTGVRVLQGLGHGLDEAALEAARGSTFEPGTHCGKPIATTFTIGMRFSL